MSNPKETVQGIRFFRQAGGCFEIGQQDESDNFIHIIHICDEQNVKQFIEDLNNFYQEEFGENKLSR